MKISSGIYQIGAVKGGYVKAGYTKSFLLEDGEDIIVVDTLYDADAKLILDEIAALGKTPKNIKHILMTHGHRGHLGGLAALKRLSGAPIYGHAWEADIISGDRSRQEPDFFNMIPLKAWPIISVGRLTARWNKHEGVPVDQLIDDGDEIGPIKVIHTPGHTPGHLAFYWPERKVLLSGDAFVTWPLITPGWRCTMLNEVQSWQSLDRMAALDVDIICPGHGDAIAHNGKEVLKALAEKGSV